jgi:hypothetical protein
VLGSASTAFSAWRTGLEERYVALGEQVLKDGVLSYTAPPGSVTTFFGR